MIKVMKGDEIQIVYTAKQDDAESTHEEKALNYAEKNGCELVYEGEEPSKKVMKEVKDEDIEETEDAKPKGKGKKK
jgi:hypothetical protein